jgi:hypothetical protein
VRLVSVSRHVASAVRSKTIPSGALAVGLLLLLQASACTGVKSEPPGAGTAPTSSASTPGEPPRPRTEPPLAAQPKPAEPPPPKPAEPPQARTAEPPRPKPPTPLPPGPAPPPPPRPAPPPPPRPNAGVPPPAQPAAIVDLTALEKRLRDTSAIGLLTKLALKNEVDDLLERVRTFHEGRGGATLAKLRERYDLLVLKVVSLLQDRDAPLARDIFTSREALWNLLADPVRFKTLGFAPTRGFAWRRE